WSRVSGVYITWLDSSGNVAHTNQAAMTLYPAMTASYEDRALIGKIGVEPSAGVAYMVLHQRLDGYDTREAAGSTYRVLLGTHPSRGGGLFVSRAGANVLSCPDSDLALSSRKLPLQAAEAGAYSPTARMTTATNATYPGGAWSWINYIDLAGSYPTYPPVIIAISNLGAMEPLPSKAAIKIHWINASRICIEVAGNWVPGAIPTGATIQWLIPQYDPSYVAPAASASTFRVQLASSGLRVSKPGVDVRYAANADLILDTSRSMLHIATRGTINNPGSVAAGTTPISSAASAMPLVLFASYTFGRWWASPNLIAVEAERTSGTTKYIGTQSWAKIGSDGIKWSFYSGSQTSSIVYSVVNFSYYS
ncbi:hypothetical protein V5F69_20325, partial [Xanthobacter sp. V2C-4]|uniref:hypothetical protein n=2 Tax=Xanthobacter albus TaxID=3119929 RepID=UPI0037281082